MERNHEKRLYDWATSVNADSRGLSFAVIGDPMLDGYREGRITRVSPECKRISVYRQTEVRYKLGGSLNVAECIKALGKSDVMFFGPLGALACKDPLMKTGPEIVGFIQALGNRIKIIMDGCVEDVTREPTIKIRTLSEGQQTGVRQDIEGDKAINAEMSDQLKKRIITHAGSLNVVVTSDYKKGTIGPWVKDTLTDMKEANPNLKIYSAPKPGNIRYIYGSDMVCVNLSEAEGITGILGGGDIGTLARMAENIQTETNAPYVVITCAEKGMFGYHDGKGNLIPPRTISNLNDVTGAGDVVLATLAFAMSDPHTDPSQNLDFQSAMELANIAAGIKVEDVGAFSVPLEKIIKKLKESA